MNKELKHLQSKITNEKFLEEYMLKSLNIKKKKKYTKKENEQMENVMEKLENQNKVETKKFIDYYNKKFNKKITIQKMNKLYKIMEEEEEEEMRIWEEEQEKEQKKEQKRKEKEQKREEKEQKREEAKRLKENPFQKPKLPKRRRKTRGNVDGMIKVFQKPKLPKRRRKTRGVKKIDNNLIKKLLKQMEDIYEKTTNYIDDDIIVEIEEEIIENDDYKNLNFYLTYHIGNNKLKTNTKTERFWNKKFEMDFKNINKKIIYDKIIIKTKGYYSFDINVFFKDEKISKEAIKKKKEKKDKELKKKIAINKRNKLIKLINKEIGFLEINYIKRKEIAIKFKESYIELEKDIEDKKKAEKMLKQLKKWRKNLNYKMMGKYYNNTIINNFILNFDFIKYAEKVIDNQKKQYNIEQKYKKLDNLDQMPFQKPKLPKRRPKTRGVKKPAKKPVKKPVKKPAKKPVKKPVKKPAKKPVKKPVNKRRVLEKKISNLKKKGRVEVRKDNAKIKPKREILKVKPKHIKSNESLVMYIRQLKKKFLSF